MTTTDGRALTFPGHSIPLKWAAVCVNHDDPVVFDVRGYDACPTCASALSQLMVTEWLKAKAGGARTGTSSPPEQAGDLKVKGL